MQGKTSDSNGLFCYFQPEDIIPENHFLKQLKKYIDFSFIRQKVKHLYSPYRASFNSSRSNDKNAIDRVFI